MADPILSLHPRNCVRVINREPQVVPCSEESASEGESTRVSEKAEAVPTPEKDSFEMAPSQNPVPQTENKKSSSDGGVIRGGDDSERILGFSVEPRLTLGIVHPGVGLNGSIVDTSGENNDSTRPGLVPMGGFELGVHYGLRGATFIGTLGMNFRNRANPIYEASEDMGTVDYYIEYDGSSQPIGYFTERPRYRLGVSIGIGDGVNRAHLKNKNYFRRSLQLGMLGFYSHNKVDFLGRIENGQTSGVASPEFGWGGRGAVNVGFFNSRTGVSAALKIGFEALLKYDSKIEFEDGGPENWIEKGWLRTFRPTLGIEIMREKAVRK